MLAATARNCQDAAWVFAIALSIWGRKMLTFHSQEGLWNRANRDRYKKFYLTKPIVLLDTALLVLRVVEDRVRRLGVGGLFAKPRAGQNIYYIDIGMHREGSQAYLVKRWLSPIANLTMVGFEANPFHYKYFIDNVGSTLGMKTSNLALVGPDYEGDTIDLYLDNRDGLGDTIIPQENSVSLRVPVIRLSEWLKKENVDLKKQIVILRMNIEGAELGVIEDLVVSGLLADVDGLFGMWNDVEKKSSPETAKHFYDLLKRYEIRNVTFNGRDEKVPFRLSAIRYKMMTDIIAAGEKVV